MRLQIRLWKATEFCSRGGHSIQSANRSRLPPFFRPMLFDIYTRAVSDVTRISSARRSFTGKGIYEVKTFQQVLSTGSRATQSLATT